MAVNVNAGVMTDVQLKMWVLDCACALHAFFCSLVQTLAGICVCIGRSKARSKARVPLL